MRFLWKWSAGIAALGLTASIFYPFFQRASTPPRQTFHITTTFFQAAHDKDTFDAAKFTRQSVVLEGPCHGGCHGGVLRGQIPFAARQNVSGLQNYDGETTALIWLYNIEPISVERRNDIFGDDELTIYGRPANNARNYFALVPSFFVVPQLQWIFVKTND